MENKWRECLNVHAWYKEWKNFWQWEVQMEMGGKEHNRTYLLLRTVGGWAENYDHISKFTRKFLLVHRLKSCFNHQNQCKHSAFIIWFPSFAIGECFVAHHSLGRKVAIGAQWTVDVDVGLETGIWGGIKGRKWWKEWRNGEMSIVCLVV